MKVAKHCEWCGKYSDNSFYRFIGEVENEFLLDSPLIANIDTINKLIVLKSGQTMSYLAMTSRTQAVTVVDFIPHIFCSEICEDAFVNDPRFLHRQELRFKTPVIECRKLGIFNPLSVPIEHIQHQMDRCETCNKKFPNLHKSFICHHIIESKILSGSMTIPPPIEPSPNAIAFSDMNKKHPLGNWYYFVFDDVNSKTRHLFCSNECAFKYSESNDSLIVFKNNTMLGNKTCINPWTVKINEGLGNSYLFRPQKVQI